MAHASQASSHPFDEAMALVPLAPRADEHGSEPPREFEGRTHPAYANMVGPFGGVTAAQALQAVLRHPQRLGDPISLTVNFAAGLADGPFRIEATPVRTNRSTQHWTVTLWQTGTDGLDTVMLTATAVTAVRRATWGAVDEAMPSALPPSSVPSVPFTDSVRWVSSYDMRLVAGTLPKQWDGAEADSLTQLWLRDNPPRSLDYASLTALADAFFPRIWRRRARMTPIGTVSMTVYYHAGPEELAATGEGFLFGQARSQSFFNGFFDQSAQLWSETGHLLATTHQIVYYKE
ncbi:acyl-CoA thioesterase [Ottowia thiooxydans]|uniref:Acyl-CoA thioesterase n=1 Tax=Ottowia thiooxydans TaxID=219182 RepID=A0ABV2QFY6_9BURK